MKRKFSLADIAAYSEEDLGQGEFCFLVAEILLERFPDAVLFRLTDPQKGDFAHVFVEVDSKPIDIVGYGNVANRTRERQANYNLVAEQVELQNMREHFYPCYRNPEGIQALCFARAKIQEYIYSNPKFASPSGLREKTA